MRRLFIQHLDKIVESESIAVVSPDPGGVKRAQLFREFLETRLGRPVSGALIEKRRSAGKVTGSLLVGEVEDRIVLVIDDLISTGGTIVRAAQACLKHGARQVHALAAHGLFTGKAAELIADPGLHRIYVTDTIAPTRLDPGLIGRRVEIISAAPLFAEVIKRLHSGGSITDLLEGCD
jgi:ribose-phosphate pyrophosphokinase